MADMVSLDLTEYKNPFLVGKPKRKRAIVVDGSPVLVYAYMRGSNVKVEKENQHYELCQYAEKKGLKIDYVVEETVSGTKHHGERSLGALLHMMQPGDLLIVSELSRLARNLMTLMEILRYAMDKGIQIRSIKDNYVLGDDITSKVLAFAFGLAAEVERKMISDRTKTALARRRAEGVILGRPKGKKSKQKKLDVQHNEIKKLLDKRISVCGIARLLGVHRMTVSAAIKEHKLKQAA